MNSSVPQPSSLYNLTIAHYLISASCFLAMAVMLLFASDELNGHYFHPQLLAITHTAALGWGTLIVFGACYQLLPVILETELHSYKLSWLSLGLFVTGLILLVWAFWTFDPGLYMQAGSVLLVLAIILFTVNTFLTASRVKKQNIHQEFIVTASGWLTATAILGAMMVFNFRYPFLPQDHLQFLKLHAHMGIGGWFLLLIIGVSSKLVPMFLVSTKQTPAYLSWSYYLINAALLLFLIDTYRSGINTKTYIIAFIAVAGIASWLLFIFQCFKSRMRKTVDLPIWHTVLSVLLLISALVVLPFIIFYQLKADPLAIRNSNLYGTLLIMGWITALILGQTFKTLPFIAWVKHYHHLVGRGNIPLPADLYNKKLLKSQLLIFAIFNTCFYSGLILQAEILVKTGLICFLITSVVYMMNVLIVILHQSKSTKYGTI
jgi:hypothetical protein